MLQKTLERLAELLNKVQKALGEYLERERTAFPRFYFVGDEDLLEMIGNSKDATKTLKHLRKMFAGIHSVVFDAEGAMAMAMLSHEGEEVPFVTPVNVQVRMPATLLLAPPPPSKPPREPCIDAPHGVLSAGRAARQ